MNRRLQLSDLTEEQLAAAKKYVAWGIRKGMCRQPVDEERAREFGRKLMAVHGRRCRKVVIVQSPAKILPAKGKRVVCRALQYCRDFLARRMINHVTFPLRFALFSGDNPTLARYDVIQKKPPVLSYSYLGNADWWYPVQVVGNGITLYTSGQIARGLLDDVADYDLWKWLCAKIVEPVRKRIPDIVIENLDTRTSLKTASLNGQTAAPQAAAVKYLREVCGVTPRVAWELEEQVEFGGVYLFSNHVVICQRLSYIEPMSNGRLHRDGGGVIEYPDGFGVFALNNVIVPEWLAVGKAENIDPTLFASIGNVDVRREFVRKIGIERIYQKLGGNVIDRQGEYELVLIHLGGRVGLWPYLKMKNPSIGVWHLEAVPESVNTVDAALRWRNGTNLQPSQLT